MHFYTTVTSKHLLQYQKHQKLGISLIKIRKTSTQKTLKHWKKNFKSNINGGTNHIQEFEESLFSKC